MSDLRTSVFGLGRSGSTAAIQECLRRRDLIADAIRAADPEAEIRPAPASPVVVADLSTPDGLLSKELTERYRLLPVNAPAPGGRTPPPVRLGAARRGPGRWLGHRTLRYGASFGDGDHLQPRTTRRRVA